MNVYIVVEGEGETKIYPEWIRHVDSGLTRVDRPDAASQNNYYLIGGQGYPNYFDVIRNAIADVAVHLQYDRLVVAVDSENDSRAAKLAEISQLIRHAGCRVPHRIIVQHFCLETWGLGNKQAFQRNPSSEELKKLVAFYDVSARDPELLTVPPDEQLNRAQVAYKYLRLLLREKNPRLIYSKRNPRELGEAHYFARLRERLQGDGHIQSFADFLTAFV